MDLAHSATDKKIKKLEKQIETVYQEALVDIENKLNDFAEKYKVKEAIHLQELKDGKITQTQFDNWKKGQVFQDKQWEAKRDQVITTIHNSNSIATKIINRSMVNVFAFNANYESYDLEHGCGINFGFGVYDNATVVKLIKDDPDLLPKWKIDEEKDYIWNKKKVNNAITQGIIQGEGISQITNRISKGLVAQNENTMKTFARTAMTEAQNAGRDQSLMNAKSKGINVYKEWMATLDGRTRDSHRWIDGEKIKVGDKWHPMKFSNGCRYPGDPEGPAHEVYNCRCTMVGDVEGYPSVFERYDNIDGKPVKSMTYKEWYKTKYGKDLEAPKTKVSKSKPKGIDYSKATSEGVFTDAAYTKERKDAALWAKNSEQADKALRARTGEVWRSATEDEKDAIFEYTDSYSKFNEPLRGWEYGETNYKTGVGFKGVGNTDLNAGYANNGKRLNAMTDIIDKCSYDQDVWLQRGCKFDGMNSFFNCNMDLLKNGTQEELEQALLGTMPTEYGFMSCGSSKGRGFSGNIMLNIYAPEGTKMMYVEPFSAFGNGAASISWDGLSSQSSLGSELETILQQGTQFRVVKIEKAGGKLYFDLEVINQDHQQRWT